MYTIKRFEIVYIIPNVLRPRIKRLNDKLAQSMNEILVNIFVDIMKSNDDELGDNGTC